MGGVWGTKEKRVKACVFQLTSQPGFYSTHLMLYPVALITELSVMQTASSPQGLMLSCLRDTSLTCMMLNFLFAGEGWTYKSSVDQSYQQYGAYYDHVKKKLEFQNQPKSKVKVRINL